MNYSQSYIYIVDGDDSVHYYSITTLSLPHWTSNLGVPWVFYKQEETLIQLRLGRKSYLSINPHPQHLQLFQQTIAIGWSVSSMI